MRTSLRRAVASATTLVTLSAALVLGTAAPAAAESSFFCPEGESLRVVTINDGATKVWIYETNGDIHICFNIDNLLRGDLILRGGIGGGPLPVAVLPHLREFDCTWIFHLADPAELILKLNPSLPGYFCIGVNDVNIGFSIVPGGGSVSPTPELWLDDTFLAFQLCFWTFRPSCSSSAFPMRFV